MSPIRLAAGPVGALAMMAALVPPGVVAASRALWPAQGPTSAFAVVRDGSVDEPAASIVWSPSTESPQERAAAEFNRGALSQAFGRSPFPAPTPVMARAASVGVPQTPADRIAAEFPVTSILNGKQAVAIVAGKVCRVGMKLTSKGGESWIVTAIDAATGTVEIESVTQGKVSLRLSQPNKTQ